MEIGWIYIQFSSGSRTNIGGNRIGKKREQVWGGGGVIFNMKSCSSGTLLEGLIKIAVLHKIFSCVFYLWKYVDPGGVYLAADGRADERDDHAAAHPRDEGQLPGAQQGARTSLPEQQGTGPPSSHPSAPSTNMQLWHLCQNRPWKSSIQPS